MVYLTDTYELCHQLSDEGQSLYKKFLEDIALDIIDNSHTQTKPMTKMVYAA